jgi:class 3 adenylate cyclase
MPDPAGSTATASVVFLALANFAQRPVAEQARLKERLEALIARAIEPLAAADRIVADTADGAALVVLAPPADALLLARRARRAARETGDPLPLRVGVNHGPVGIVTDASGEARLVGDGIAAGASITPFAEPGQVVASRAFRDALETADAERAARLRLAGTVTDSSLRAHELYAFDPAADGGSLDAPARPRRRTWLIAGLSVAAILAAGVAARGMRRVAARAKQPGLVDLQITPWGEIRVDGESRGRSPPLKRMEVGPGRHTIEVRHPQHAPITVQVDVSPGEQVTVQHAFATPRAAPTPAPAPGKSERKFPTPAEVWRDFRRQTGL